MGRATCTIQVRRAGLRQPESAICMLPTRRRTPMAVGTWSGWRRLDTCMTHHGSVDVEQPERFLACAGHARRGRSCLQRVSGIRGVPANAAVSWASANLKERARRKCRVVPELVSGPLAALWSTRGTTINSGSTSEPLDGRRPGAARRSLSGRTWSACPPGQRMSRAGRAGAGALLRHQRRHPETCGTTRRGGSSGRR